VSFQHDASELRQRQVPGIPRQLDVAIPIHILASARPFKADGSLPVCDCGEIDFLVGHPRADVEQAVRFVQLNLPRRRIYPTYLRTAPLVKDSDTEVFILQGLSQTVSGEKVPLDESDVPPPDSRNWNSINAEPSSNCSENQSQPICLLKWISIFNISFLLWMKNHVTPWLNLVPRPTQSQGWPHYSPNGY